MVNYRRNRIDGGCYFFTVTLRDRKSDILIRNYNLLRESFLEVHRKHPFTVDAAVILPDHLHTIWTLPEIDSDYPGRWKAIKARFTWELRKNNPSHESPWQPRYWEHTIRNNLDWRRHMDYIHYNPVKHGHVSRPRDWVYSSFQRCVKAGLYDIDWGAEVSQEVINMALE